MGKINLEINNLTPSRIDKKFLKKIAGRVSKLVKFKIPELSVVIVSGARMKSLNRKYRGRNRVTDVLAFDYGEIILCLSQAKKQAKKLSHSLKKELAILLIHGILHLVGYNDKTKRNYNKMVKKEEEICQKLIL
ncbi:MAG: rRNA maturation RNase YbeY [Patescibacteria group bacterium]